MTSVEHDLITTVGSCRAIGARACRPGCTVTNGRLLQWDEARVSRRISQMRWVPEADRTELARVANQFLSEQGERIRRALALEQPEIVTDGTTLCGCDQSIAAARKIIDLSVGLLLPAGRAGQVPSDVISHRRHVAGSTLRHAEERVRQSERQFFECAQNPSMRFQVTSEQVASMMDGRSNAVMTSIDPHGELRQQWRELRTRKAVVEECKAATECFERFVRDHDLATLHQDDHPLEEAAAYG